MNEQENKKPTEKKGMTTSGIILASFFMFLLGVLAIRGGLKGLRVGEERQNAEQNLQDRMESLPVLSTDEEISNALSGEPKDYLIRNYVFKNPPTIKDTAFNLLTSDYICVYVIEEGSVIACSWQERQRSACVNAIAFAKAHRTQEYDHTDYLPWEQRMFSCGK